MANIPWYRKPMHALARTSIANMGNVLVLTSIAGWVASSAAQIFGIATNKKYSNSQKRYMISQETADASVNIGSYLMLTQPLVLLSSKLLSTGKIAPKEVVNFMRQTKTIARRGQWNFDVTKVPGFTGSVKNTYDMFKGFTGSVAALAGGIIASNLITPILRNKIASRRQKKYLTQLNATNTTVQNPVTPTPVTKPAYTRPADNRFKTFDTFRHYSNNMTI